MTSTQSRTWLSCKQGVGCGRTATCTHQPVLISPQSSHTCSNTAHQCMTHLNVYVVVESHKHLYRMLHHGKKCHTMPGVLWGRHAYISAVLSLVYSAHSPSSTLHTAHPAYKRQACPVCAGHSQTVGGGDSVCAHSHPRGGARHGEAWPEEPQNTGQD